MTEKAYTTAEILDEAHGPFSIDQPIPTMGVPGAGGMWPEGRTFARLFNECSAGRMLQVLVGMQDFLMGNADAADAVVGLPLSEERRNEAVHAIATLVEVTTELVPGVISDEPTIVTSSFPDIKYRADEYFQRMVQRAIDRGNGETDI